MSKRHTSEASRVRPKRETQDELWIKHQRCCRSRPSHRANQSHDLGHVTAHPNLLISAKQPCKSFNQTRPRDRATQSPDLHQAIVEIILPTRPCNRGLWARPPVLSPAPMQAIHSHVWSRHLECCLKAPELTGESCHANDSSHASPVKPAHHSRPTASQPCIDPPSVSEGSHQAEPLCSDQRTDTCSRKPMKHKRSPLERVQLSTDRKSISHSSDRAHVSIVRERRRAAKSSCQRAIVAANSLKFAENASHKSLVNACLIQHCQDAILNKVKGPKSFSPIKHRSGLHIQS